MQSQLKDARTQIGKKCDDELLFNDVIVDVDDELYSIMRNENNENNEESSEDEWSNIDLTNHLVKSFEITEETIAKQNLNSFEACLAATGSKKITSIFPSQASRIISSSSSNNTNDIPSSSLNEPDIMPVFDVNIDKK
ncbi:22166_t:CDS:2 [Entrophospora sp. SA101]|nr:24805_t:CDS:2 [Entrophospora sp. SA101]CAJ0768355.1 22166_t:CDS:2 [Entrophospora sp. SA101]